MENNMSIDFLNGLHIDVLKEIGNIGIGNAASSLSAFLGKPVGMTVPEAKFLNFSEVGSILGGDEAVVFGILVGISGDINGMMMFIIKPEAARNLVDEFLISLSGSSSGAGSEEFSEMDLSALKEIGNILCSAYLGSLSSFIGLKITPTPPMIAQDMATSILSVPATEFGKMSDGVLFIDTTFETDTDNTSGYFLLVPDIESFKTILASLGVV